MDADGSNKTADHRPRRRCLCPVLSPLGREDHLLLQLRRPVGSRVRSLDGGPRPVEDLERITFTEGFDGFPMWSPDGKTFVFCSNRNNSKPGETNVFVTEWKD